MWLISQGELNYARCQMGNLKCIGPLMKRISLHPDAEGRYIPGFLSGTGLGRQRQSAIREAWIYT